MMSELPDATAPAGPVREDMALAHQRAWQRVGRPGTWWDAEQRVAIAAETRNAVKCPLCRRRRAALSPYTIQGTHQSLMALPEIVVEVIHRVCTDSGRLSRSWLQSLVDGGLSVDRYVETVGVVAQVMAIDGFARGIGAPPAPLPTPIAGAPSRRRPRGAKRGGAWVPWIEPEDLGDDEAGLYPGGSGAANIRKAMSLVPAEVRGFFELVETQYLPAAAMRDFSREYRAISHPQIELLAARVSALNRCVY
jgi:hypothetical protein